MNSVNILLSTTKFNKFKTIQGMILIEHPKASKTARARPDLGKGRKALKDRK